MDEAYSYDANGNRTMSGYSTGTNNRLTSDGVFNYTYDDEGNRLSRTNISTSESTEYSWDFRNRLTQVTEKDSYGTTTQVVEYTYDVFNRRIGKAVDSSSPFNMADAVIERYILDDASGVSSVDGGNVVLDFVDPDGSGSATMDLARRYLYGAAVDQLLAQENVDELLSSADRVMWPLVDNLGTVRDLALNDGTLGEHYTYDSYGNVLSGDISLTRYLYTSREYDADTGLQYNRARWYDPATGRWISEDPIGFAAGDANISRYVGNRPSNAIDPSGLLEEFPLEWHHEHVKALLLKLKLITPDGATTEKVTGGSLNVHDAAFGTMLPEDVHRRRSAEGIHCKDASGVTYDSYYRDQVELRLDEAGNISIDKLEEARMATIEHYKDHFDKGYKAQKPWEKAKQTAWETDQRIKLGLPKKPTPPSTPGVTEGANRILKGTSRVTRSVLPVAEIYLEISEPLRETIEDSRSEDHGWLGFFPRFLENIRTHAKQPCFMNGFRDLNTPARPGA